MYDYLVVGAGLFGATFAWHATRAGKRVLVVDRRKHIGGNCYTYNDAGIHVHAYGPHIFHTSSERIWNFVNSFVKFNTYTHRVKATNGNSVYSLPFNMMTLHQLWGVTTPDEAEERFARIKSGSQNIQCDNVEDWALNNLGVEAYEKLIKGYTIKQWMRDPKILPASIIRRLPVRLTWDDNYFDDKYQGIPVDGYTGLFERLLEDSTVELGSDFLDDRALLERISRKTVYTGPLDELYAHCLGTLGYRTLSFATSRLPRKTFRASRR